MPLPRTLVYNDLSGDEVKHILVERFAAILHETPYLQKHITLPRVRMTLNVQLDCWADQPTPDSRSVLDTVDILSEAVAKLPNAPDLSMRKTDVVDASRKGDPPDKVREEHGLGVPTPVRGAVAVEDHVEGARVSLPNGAIVDRTGKATQARSNATVIEQDFGPGKERMKRETQELPLRNQHRSGPVAPPNWNNTEQE